MIGIARRRILLPTEDGGEYVDLGLPSGLKWATGNIVKDAQGNYSIGNETDYGCYFSWGNIIGHNAGDGYDFGTSNSGPYANTPGASVNTDISPTDAFHDAALACLGVPWHLPTKENFQELYNNTDNEWTTIDGVSGWKFMNKDNHFAYIFLPAAGVGYSSYVSNHNQEGYYMSSYSGSSDVESVIMYFNRSQLITPYWFHRFYGLSIRAVRSA